MLVVTEHSRGLEFVCDMTGVPFQIGLCAGSGDRENRLAVRKFLCPTERVHESHLIHGRTFDFEEARTREDHRQASCPGDPNIEPIPAV